MILLFPLFSGTAFVNAQVRIGANAVPEKGTVLDLNSTFKGGLLLPNVNITDLGKIPATFTDATVAGQDIVPALAGMIVWNTNTTTGPGVFMWDGANWHLLKARDCVFAPATPGAITLSSTSILLGDSFKASVPAVPGATSYVWTLPSGLTGSSDSASITVTPGSVGINPAGSITVAAVNECGKSATSISLYGDTVWAGGCGAYLRPGYWKPFLCYNLGADPTLTVQQQMAYVSTGPTDSTVYGALYQWGRVADGHQLRTSPRYPTNDNSAENSPIPDTDLDANGQVVSTSLAFGKFVKANISPWNWRATFNNLLWTAYPSNNPCPANYRVPSSTEWAGVVDYNTHVFTGFGMMLSNDSNRYVLYLPATGWRLYTTGGTQGVGSTGRYWSRNTVGGDGGARLNFSATTIDANSTDGRAQGYGVRCVYN